MVDLGALAYPRHVHRPVPRAAWDAGVREFRSVGSAHDCARALDEGYALVPVIVEPDAAVPAVLEPPDEAQAPDLPSDAPAKRKPGRPRKQDN